MDDYHPVRIMVKTRTYTEVFNAIHGTDIERWDEAYSFRKPIEYSWRSHVSGADIVKNALEMFDSLRRASC